MRRSRHFDAGRVPRTGFALALLVGLATADVTHAALGGPVATVEADRVHMAAHARAIAATTHTEHALTLANGGVAREFVGLDGRVFAVAWRSPSRPDLKQLLGDYFDVMQADNVRPGGRRSRRPLAVRRSDVVIQSAGRPGAFWGLAYLPGVTPAGFSADDLR